MKYLFFLAVTLVFTSISLAQDSSLKTLTSSTHRVLLLENDQVKVWKTTIAPKQPLSFHRHEKPRVVVPITDTQLKVQEKTGETKSYDWKKGDAYWLNADPAGTLHGDVNESDHPMEVIVVEMK